ncbi:MAG: biopolymer transporter ExbD [Myxococcota bacterium]
MRRSRSSGGGESEVDITPMLDVVFIMLIFFIVTASFVKEAGVNVNRPKAETASTRASASILIAITSNDEVWIDKKAVDIRAVRAIIERLRQENPKGTVVIQADRDSKNGLLVKVVDAAKMAGAPEVAISAVQE